MQSLEFYTPSQRVIVTVTPLSEIPLNTQIMTEEEPLVTQGILSSLLNTSSLLGALDTICDIRQRFRS